MKEYLKRHKELKKQASTLLYNKGIHDILSSQEEVLYAGSYELDLMIWEDIDLNIIVEKENQNSVAKSLVCSFLDRDDVDRVRIFRDLRKKYGTAMPEGHYIGLKIGKWKLDIHIVSKDQAEETKKTTENILSLLTDESRDKILYWKEKLLTDVGRTPKFLSFHLYNAILIHKYEKDEDILDYLKINGVVV